ncbi:putative signal recognition particle protein [Leptomonas pyrrhocoris]|uniref:Signal recognition particle subunit SRP72 n=1 Tax=Leptomonas pyrrhocoris TaxID=157538 RepID=A0A0N0VG54_LEPPY|nr:putative signal recognition particle protein [Leptomonas pyrrhocoris]KPA82734.1 putative signal recognition particle protein [Leptomonas pyrrhocoris]|eukprot:XP_015661173.1 putative signal recognition particle protein [Leptomonas pyrrhocoris]
MSEVSKLEKTLRKQTSSADVEPSKVASTAERILTLQPHNIYAMQCKSVALLHTGKLAAALRVFEELEKEKTPVTASATFLFHKAYCHYRLMQYGEARAVLTRHQGTATTPMRHLLAQIHYNLEEYAEAAAMYAALVADGACADDTEKQELLTNYTAALSASDPAKVAAVVRDEAEEKTPDLLFNLAVAQLEAHHYDDAQATLLQAERRCANNFPQSALHSLQEALAAEPETLQARLGVPLVASTHTGVGDPASRPSAERLFFNEVSSNWVQQAYVWFLCHREAEAQRVVELIFIYKPASAVTTAVASLLWTALHRGSDLFDSHRKLKTAQHVKVVARLTARQVIAVQYNTALLHLSTGALDRCARTVQQMEKSFPHSELTQSLRLVLAVRELKKKKGSAASVAGDNVSAVQECVRRYEAEATARRGANSPSEASRKKQHRFIQMIAAQLFLEQGDVAHAVEAVEGMEDAAFLQRPATVVTLAAWKTQSGDADGATRLLKQRLTATSAADSYSVDVKRAILLWAVHDLAVSRGFYAEVGQLLKAVQSADVSLARDRDVAALLVVCLAESNVVEAKRHMAALDAAAAAVMSGAGSSGSTTVAPSEQEVHARIREHPGQAAMNELGYRRVTAADQEEVAAEGDAGKQQKTGGLPSRRRRAMRRPAKNMEGKPDPERWIPMSVRSYVKDLPERRKKELKRLRAIDQEQKRRAAVARQKKAAEDVAVAE